MLAKLLKYDFVALSRILVPVHLIALAVGVVALVCFGFARMMTNDDTILALGPMAALGFTGGGICILVLAAAPVATFVIVVRRWYVNLFTDEGYLTLTLPVGPGAHVASKTIVGFAWMLIDLAILVVLFVSVMAVLSGDVSVMYRGFLESGSLDMLGRWARLSSFIQVLAILLLAYASLALGSVAASRHRVAAGVGIFVGASWLVGLVSAFASVTATYLAYPDSFVSALSFPPPAMAYLTSTVGLVLWLAFAAALYAFCVYLLKNKVNLP